MKKTKNKIKKKLTKKFRLVVLNEASFEERFSFKLTRLNVFVFGGLVSILLIGITAVIIAFTPIKEYIPGYSSTKLKRQAISLFYKVDSLQSKLSTLTKFTAAIRPILIGKDTVVDITLPYKNIKIEQENGLKFPVRNDSISALILEVKREIDSTYKAYYNKETDLMQLKHQGIEDSQQKLHEHNIDELKQQFVSTIENQEDSISKLASTIIANENEIFELKKQIALNELVTRQNLQSLSAENQNSVAEQNKNAEKSRNEVKQLLQKEYQANENKLLEAHETELRSLNAKLFKKEAVIDSLIFKIVQQQQRKIGELSYEEPFSNGVKPSESELLRSANDSVFRADIERQDRYSLFDFETKDTEDVVFFSPVKGIITDRYSAKDKHYAIDIAVTKGTGVRAVADGTIIFAERTLGTGYVVIIEHANKYLSVYKHNEMLYRNQGDLVKSGEVISMAGSSGEYSTGTHLHFEMWYQGYSINPINFIEFE